MEHACSRPARQANDHLHKAAVYCLLINVCSGAGQPYLAAHAASTRSKQLLAVYQ
jgi:hypothetical protein